MVFPPISSLLLQPCSPGKSALDGWGTFQSILLRLGAAEGEKKLIKIACSLLVLKEVLFTHSFHPWPFLFYLLFRHFSVYMWQFNLDFLEFTVSKIAILCIDKIYEEVSWVWKKWVKLPLSCFSSIPFFIYNMWPILRVLSVYLFTPEAQLACSSTPCSFVDE